MHELPTSLEENELHRKLDIMAQQCGKRSLMEFLLIGTIKPSVLALRFKDQRIVMRIDLISDIGDISYGEGIFAPRMTGEEKELLPAFLFSSACVMEIKTKIAEI